MAFSERGNIKEYGETVIPIIFAVGITAGTIGGILMKIGASHLGSIQLNSFHEALTFLGKIFTDLTTLGGMALYFFSALVWLYLLTKLDISFVQPILALTYITTPVLAMIFLGENVPVLRWVGIAIIIIGVCIVAQTSTKI